MEMKREGKGKGERKGDRQDWGWKGSKGYQDGKSQAKSGFKHRKSGNVPRLSLPTAKSPEISAGASYSYAAKSPFIDVLTPAWHSRSLRPELPHVDLRFETLQGLQMPSGGFKVSPLLLGHLGATEPEPVLKLAKGLQDSEAEILGARLVLKSAEFYNVEVTSRAMEAMCLRCKKLIASVSKDVKEAWDDDSNLEEMNKLGREDLQGDVDITSSDIEKLLDITFGIVRGLWSFFELWERLLPSKISEPLRSQGGILCTRFFLVDLAAAAWSPYDIDKSYPLFRGITLMRMPNPRSGKNVFMGQMSQFEAHDRMRQGHQLEAAWVENSQVEEEKILMALQLPCGRQVLFAAAPDAMDPSLDSFAPVETPEAFAEAGYEEVECLAYPSDAAKSCRIWRKQGQKEMSNDLDVPLSAYVEIKKTTHLNGLNGGFKLLNYWLQAALMKAGTVCVAFADADVVSHGQKFSVSQLQQQIQERFQDPEIIPKVWSSLFRSLELVIGTPEGRSQLHLHKRRGFGEPLQVEVEEGWGDMTETMEADPFTMRAEQLFKS